jgi:ATP-dependent DNA ligase
VEPAPGGGAGWWPDGVALARAIETLPSRAALPGGCQYEPKWDGFRALIRVDPDGARIRSRHGTDLTAAFADVAAAAAEQLHAGTVLDGELVVWDPDSGRLDFAALQRRLAAPRRAAVSARRRPASFVAFDILADAGVALRGHRLRHRRRVLERLGRLLDPPLQVTPATTSPDVAAAWLRDYADADVGIEGLVIKGLGQTYRPGARTWLKLRTRDTTEAVVGAVTGSPARPERLILGLPDHRAGRLRIAGSTNLLSARQQADVATYLRRPAGPHPWPPRIPAGRLAGFGRRDELPVTLVEPLLVVEIQADAAFEHGRWRHVTRYSRIRAELRPEDLSASPGNA